MGDLTGDMEAMAMGNASDMDFVSDLFFVSTIFDMLIMCPG